MNDQPKLFHSSSDISARDSPDTGDPTQAKMVTSPFTKAERPDAVDQIQVFTLSTLRPQTMRLRPRKWCNSGSLIR